MASVIGSGISHFGFPVPAAAIPFNLHSSVVAADVGKPVSISGTRQVRVAADGARIVGRLKTFEDRVSEGVKVGTVEMQGGFKWAVKAADALAVGDSCVGAANGEIKTTATANGTLVTAVSGGFAEVLMF